MKSITVGALLFRPQAVRQAAAGQPETAAILMNAVSGLFVIASATLPMLSFFTAPLVALLIVIFGPFAGFVVSSLYPRVEWTVGRRLGGKASLGELYRLFAWSFLPAGFAALLYGLVVCAFKEPSTLTVIVVSIPSLVIFCLAVRNYISNVIASQQFTRKRGAVSVVLSFLLFLILMGGGVGFLFLLIR
jgi:hypothetical protein